MNEVKPLLLRLLRSFCPSHLYEEIEGDLIQKFNRDVKDFGEGKARWRLLWNVIRFFRMGILLRNKLKYTTPMPLFQNNLVMAFRTLRKNKLFSSINVFVLSVSMAVCLLIFQYAFYELSFDKQFSKDIYRVGTVVYQKGEEYYSSANSPTALTSLFKEKLPEVTDVLRMYSTSGWFDCALSYSEGESVQVFNENRGFYFVDPSFVSFFDVVFLKGDMTSALSKPFSIVLSETSAKKYFGDKDPLGKILTLRASFASHEYTVTGVMKDFPANSHINARILSSLSSLSSSKEIDGATTYVRLNNHSDIKSLETKMTDLANTVIPKTNGQETEFILEPIAGIHLYSKLEDQFKSTGNATAVYFLMAVAVVILFIAWLNYVNLTTARSVARTKEVGIRKINGASRIQIVYQFLTETVVVNVLSLAIAIVVVYAIASTFYSWIGVSFMNETISFRAMPIEFLIVIGIFLAGIIISGIIPSQFISGLNPAKVLKGKWIMLRSRFSFRQVAVTFQFTTAFVLAISILVFQKQFDFMRSQDLGIDIKHAVVLQAPTNVDSTYTKRLASFKTQLQSLSVVRSVTTSADVPGNFIGSDWSGDVRREKDGPAVSFGVNVIDPDFIEQFGLKLVAGRNFDRNDFPLKYFGDKTESIILSRKAVERLGFSRPQEAINRIIFWGENKCRVVGVIEDYHQQSVKEPIAPMLLVANMGPCMTLKLTLNANKNAAALTQIRQAWNTHFPANAFDYYFLEDHFNKQYVSDERVAKLFHFFCLLALIISCLGLFALSLLSTQQRLREISIRKILGAPVLHLLRLLSQEYFLLLLIASSMGIPLAYFGIAEWLKSFALRISLDGTMFLIPTLLVIIIALLTAGSQAMKAIISNPTENLKHE
jgi:putative ABC transport system permease protein